MEAHRQRWQEIAAQDPDWVVLSLPRGKRGGWDTDELWETGSATVDHLLDVARRHAGEVGSALAVDVGCGVGRLTHALATRFDRVVGVDVTPAMLERAADRIERSNVVLRLADVAREQVAEAQGADLVVSERVLQHLPTEELAPHLCALVDLARPGGLVVLQVPVALPLSVRLEPRRRLYGLLRRLGVPARFLYWRLGLHPMRMQSVEVGTVRRIVAGQADIVGLEEQHEAAFDVREAVIVLRRRADEVSAG